MMSEEATEIIDDGVEYSEDETPEVVESPEGEDSEQNQDGAPGEKPESITFTPEQQEKFNAEIGRKVAKQKEAERKAEEAENRYREAQEKLSRYENAGRPEIPPIPDPFEDHYDAKIQHRDQALIRAAEYDNQQRYAQHQAQQAQQESIRQAQEAMSKTATSYAERGEKLGVKGDELAKSGSAVFEYGIADSIAERLLKDQSGPLITVYLSRNLTELDKLNEMNAGDAAIYIENTIKPLAKRRKPDLAPEPVDSPSGSSMPEGENGPAGVIYE